MISSSRSATVSSCQVVVEDRRRADARHRRRGTCACFSPFDDTQLVEGVLVASVLDEVVLLPAADATAVEPPTTLMPRRVWSIGAGRGARAWLAMSATHLPQGADVVEDPEAAAVCRDAQVARP